MDELKVNGFIKFHDVISQNHSKWRRWFYRGHSSPTYELVPSAGRLPFSSTDDHRMLEAWKRHAVPYLAPLPREMTVWEHLAIAQHHGLATRLLDWTFNALAAAFLP